MKKIIGLLVAVVSCTASMAQVLAPSLPDQLWASTSTSVVNGINTALIDYPLANQLWGQLGACAHGALSGTVSPYNGVIVTDFTFGTTVTVPYPAGLYDMTSVPDVIIGNNILSSRPDAEFIMAVSFVNNNIPAQIEVDFFDIVYTGPGIFTVTYNSSQYMPTYAFTNWLGTVHMDVVAESANPVFNRPGCDKFFLTYDANYGGTYEIFGAYGSLSTYSLIVGPINVADTFHHADNWQPDVAGVQTKDASGVHNIGIFTWVNQCNCALYTMTWNPLTGSTGGSVYNAPGGPGIDPYSYPRIDANDDLYSNFSPSNANYKVVVEHVNTFTGTVNCESFDNLSAGVATSAWCGGTPINNYRPTVAYGQQGSGGNQYMLVETLGGPMTSKFTMSPVVESMPTSLAACPGIPGAYSFQVNNTGGIGSGTIAQPTHYTNAVSTACNRTFDTSLVAWADFSGGTYRIWYKRSGYDWSAYGYAYKQQSNTASVAESTNTTLWPNPASSSLYISSVGHYSIWDMMGRQLLSGNLLLPGESVSITSLPAGNYTLKLTDNHSKTTYGHFTKQ